MIRNRMGRRRRVRALVGPLVVTGMLIAGCGGDDEAGSAGSSSPDQATEVRVGMLPISNAAPLYLGVKKGFFKKEGLQVEPVLAQSGNEIITTLLADDFDFGFVGFVPGMVAVSKGLPLKIIASGDTGAESAADEWTHIVVSKDSPIRDVQDLEGSTIAVNALKGVGEVVIKAALEKRGVDPASIKLLEVPFPDMPAALERGRVEAIWAPEPFLSSVLAEGARAIEAPLTTLGPNYPNGTYATTDKQIEEDEESVSAFTRAINRSMEYATQHPDEARATIPDFTEIPKEVAEKIRLPLWPVPIEKAKVEELARYTAQFKLAEKAPPLDELIWEGATTTD